MTAIVSSNRCVISESSNYCSNSNSSLKVQSNDDGIRKIYSKTLQAMKTTHLTAYYQSQDEIYEGEDEVNLPRVFVSFDPSPFKLIALNFCQNSVLYCDLPEVFTGLEMEFCGLQAQFQKLNAEEKHQILDDLIEHTSTVCMEFHSALDVFVKKIKESFEASRIKQVFKQDVAEARKLISFLKELMHLEMESEKRTREEPVPFDLTFIRVLSKIIRSHEIPSFTSDLLIEHLSSLAELRKKYASLSANSKSLLDLEFRFGRYGIGHQPEAEKVLLGIEQIITKIKSNNKDIIPVLIFLAHKNSNCL